MKKKLNTVLILITVMIITLISCNKKKENLSHEQIVRNYYAGLNTSDFDLVSECISDSVIYADNDYTIANNHRELYLFFKWDSVFDPKYEISDIRKDSNSIKLTVSKICKRIEFLQDTPTMYNVTVDFKNNLINKLQITENIFFDTVTWIQRRDTLIAWTDRTHPELSGFFNEASYLGAVKYSKAIDLYREEN